LQQERATTNKPLSSNISRKQQQQMPPELSKQLHDLQTETNLLPFFTLSSAGPPLAPQLTQTGESTSPFAFSGFLFSKFFSESEQNHPFCFSPASSLLRGGKKAPASDRLVSISARIQPSILHKTLAKTMHTAMLILWHSHHNFQPNKTGKYLKR
jgi:hypothetical protein